MDEFRQQLVSLLPRLRRFALALSADPVEADDLLQTACEKALQARAQWQPGSRLDSWLYRILQNQWIDQQRGRQRHGEVDDPELLEQLPDERWDRQLEARLTLERVLEVLAQLPEAMRSVLALVTVQGLSYQEAAEVLALPIGTVMSRLARGRLELMRRLEMTEVGRV
ncbi:MAG TPA: RNA polymerase sigma factor [Nevskiaceae bacterium]|nr:RNA polymerase sigma factor [Nevskiaceae bacterium]